MKGTDFTFGAGSRACLGRYLSQLESFKLIATFFSTFDVSSNREGTCAGGTRWGSFANQVDV